MKELKTNILNAHQLYLLLQRPAFAHLKKTRATVRAMAIRGEFGQPIINQVNRNRSVFVNLPNAYRKIFSKTMAKDAFIREINDFVTENAQVKS